jgi:hypothetical protein
MYQGPDFGGGGGKRRKEEIPLSVGGIDPRTGWLIAIIACSAFWLGVIKWVVD